MRFVKQVFSGPLTAQRLRRQIKLGKCGFLGPGPRHHFDRMIGKRDGSDSAVVKQQLPSNTRSLRSCRQIMMSLMQPSALSPFNPSYADTPIAPAGPKKEISVTLSSRRCRVIAIFSANPSAFRN